MSLRTAFIMHLVLIAMASASIGAMAMLMWQAESWSWMDGFLTLGYAWFLTRAFRDALRIFAGEYEPPKLPPGFEDPEPNDLPPRQ